jgi:hypothetical protein
LDDDVQRVVPLLTLLAIAACASLGYASEGTVREATDYPLDEVPRRLGEGDVLPCQRGEVELVSYRGEHVRYQKPVQVHPAFKPHLVAFEQLVSELGKAHFGRAPRRIQHFGAYNCRSMRNRTYLMSEHALGNALDVAGFDFGPLLKKEQASAPPELARPLRRAFQIRVDKHWNGAEKDAEKTAFLRALGDALIARPELFRSIVGPDFPNHHNHLHLSHPPYRMVKLGAVERWWWW